MRRRASVAALVGAMLLVPSVTHAWTCAEFNCPTWSGEIPVGIGPLCPDLEAIAPGTTLDEIERAMTDWALLECSEISFGAPSPTAAPLGTADGVSTLGFVESDWPHDDAAIGITTIEVVACSGVCIVEADTSFNAQGFEWVTVRGALPEVNARSIVLHELGHYLGLGHSNAAGAAMGLGYSRGYLELSADDEAGACHLYPREGSAPDCALVGCPTGRECVDGECVPAPPESCVTAMDCARDERCIEATGLCVRQTEQVPGLGDACDVDADCESQECEDLPGGRACTLTCDGLDPRSCPTGFHCDPSLTAMCGSGLCVAGGGGTGAFGSDCEQSTDCASLFCNGSVCTVPCDASATNNCPSARSCHPDFETGCGSCLSPLAIGEPCTIDSQCTSGLCFAESTEAIGWCTATCVDASDCPASFRCGPAGDESLCFPPEATGCGCAVAGAADAGATPPLGAGGTLLFLLAALCRRARRGAPRSAPEDTHRAKLANAGIRPKHAR
jgi:hypothetical protein